MLVTGIMRILGMILLLTCQWVFDELVLLNTDHYYNNIIIMIGSAFFVLGIIYSFYPRIGIERKFEVKNYIWTFPGTMIFIILGYVYHLYGVEMFFSGNGFNYTTIIISILSTIIGGVMIFSGGYKGL